MPEPGTEPPGRSALNARLITRVRRDVDAETGPPLGGAGGGGGAGSAAGGGGGGWARGGGRRRAPR